ncbi:hypothetical protein P691DRAFT_687535, partial [Macrolepiota fuliginosa MF-IS2]
MREAEFNSPPRGSPSQCCPGTYRGVINSIRTFTHSERYGLVWVHGQAAVGKSVSLQTLAKELQGDLAATFFFPKLGMCESRRVLLTIAHQLAMHYPPYCSYLYECMQIDPAFLNKTSEMLFETLFTTPTLHNLFSIHPDRHYVIIIDGLDSQDEKEQPNLLDLVHRFFRDHPTSPFMWI